jgi:hypothetical protein
MNGCYVLPSRSPVKSLRTVLAALSLIAIFGCASRLEFPPMGEPLPVSVKLEIPAAIKELRADYTDGCGHLMQVPLGARLEEALVEGAYRTFKSVSYEGGGSKDAAPEAVVRVDLVNWSFKLQQDSLYDRVPANLQLNAIARVFDMNGKVLRESEVKVVRQERLRLEAMARFRTPPSTSLQNSPWTSDRPSATQPQLRKQQPLHRQQRPSLRWSYRQESPRLPPQQHPPSQHSASKRWYSMRTGISYWKVGSASGCEWMS